MADLDFAWPQKLSLHDLLRIVWGRWQQRMPEVLADLSAKDIQMTLDEAYSIAEKIKEASDVSGFFILDGALNPEPFNPPDLPSCVLSTEDAEYIDPNKMEGILALYHGKTLPAGLNDNQRRTQLKMLHRRLVASRSCKTAGCTKRIKVTVAMAARAIEGHRLVEQGLPYELPTLCRSCRNARDHQLAERRGNKSKPKTKTMMGEIKPPDPAKGKVEPDSVPTDYSVDKLPAKVGDVHNNNEVMKEVSCGDHAISTSPPLTEEQQ